MVVGCWLLVVDCWLLVVGCWLLVFGCWLLVVVVVVVVGGGGGGGGGGGVGVGAGTNKDRGPENKLSEPILEFAWCSLRASMECSTVLEKNFGVDFSLHCSTAGLLLDHSAVHFRQKGVWQPLF